MKKTKIYFSISNQATQHAVPAAKLDFGTDFEYLSWADGNKVHEGDFVIIFPPRVPQKSKNKVYLSKGCYSEASEAMNAGKKVFIRWYGKYHTVMQLEVVDHDWSYEYATALIAPHAGMVAESVLSYCGIFPADMDKKFPRTDLTSSEPDPKSVVEPLLLLA